MAKFEYGVNDLQTLSPNIAKEWHPTLNGALNPCDVHNSGRKNVWWLCEKKHEYQLPVVKRTIRGQGCPICKREQNAFANVHPELLEYWDYEKNEGLDPTIVTFGADMKVWWKCPNGHSYQQKVYNKSYGQGCPICARPITDDSTSLEAVYPEIAKEWHPSLNGNLRPGDVHNGSSAKVYWLCTNGHTYQKPVAKRTRMGQGCPQCRIEKNAFSNVYPELLKYWDYEKNKGIDPTTISYGSEKKVWWKCPEGHSYKQSLHAKSSGAGCLICTRQLVSNETSLLSERPDIAAEWHPTKNIGLVDGRGFDISTPDKVTVGSRQKVWWLCPNGHEYPAIIYSRKRSGCPICDSEKRTSFPEQAIQYYLNKLFVAESRFQIGGFEADIYCPSLKVAIEYDGEYFHQGDANDAREERKNEFFIEQGILLFRIKESKEKVDFICHDTNYGWRICIVDI